MLLNLIPTLYITIFHLLSLFAIYCFSWKALLVCLFFHWVTGCLGITLGYHRLLTHKSFKTPIWLEYTLAIIGCMASQGSPRTWVGTHRLHHSNTDLDGDPHSPKDGFLWSHILWTMHDVENTEHLIPDLNNKFYLWLDKLHFLFNIPLAILLYYFGGWAFVVYGIFLRTVLVWHSTWSVNSLSHIFGYKRYETKDNSRNNWLVALLTYGEGWHNAHHAYPSSARHGVKWYEVDVTYYIIKLLKKLKLAEKVNIPIRFLLDSKK
jgi:fatty-acid desaturase